MVFATEILSFFFCSQRIIMEVDNYQQIQQMLGLEDDLLVRISSSYVD